MAQSRLNTKGELPPRLSLASSQVVSFNPSRDVLSASELEGILDRSIPFTFHFQPIVDLQRGVTVGYEALARFAIRDTRLPPNLVFQAAESYGMRSPLEELVLQEAVNTRTLLPPNCFLTVNVGVNFTICDRFDRLLSLFPALGGVVFEITEDEAIPEYPAIQRKLAMVRAKGALAAIDDAGSGYASLQHIMALRPNFIKLDRAFISGCCSDPAKSVLIEMLGSAANKLDAWLIAEGVETQEELHELMRLGVPLAQGYFLGYPEPEMHLLDEERSRMIRGWAEAAETAGRLYRAMEQVRTCTERAEAERLLRRQAPSSVVVLVNEFNQPTEVFENHLELSVRRLVEFTRVQVRSNARDVLARALNRPGAFRFDPLVVTDELGRVCGVIKLDRLMRENLAS